MTEQPPGSYPPPPPEGYPPPPPPGGGVPGQPPTGTNGLAIASIVCSVIGVACGFGSILGIVLGVIALNQINKTGQAGKGLAQAGIVVGVVMLILGVVAYFAWYR